MSLDNIIRYVQMVIEETDGYEMWDYLISYNREDLKNRIESLCNNSLKYKQNTTLFDFNFENNKIIKTEIFGKGTLRDFLNDDGDEYKVSGCRNVNTFIFGPNVSKSLLDISGTITPDKHNTSKAIGHHRHTSSINSSFMENTSFLKGLSAKGLSTARNTEKRVPDRFKEVEAIRRDIRMIRDVSLPKDSAILTLKEGRIFFIGGNHNEKTCDQFIEFIEESNTLIYHAELNCARQNLGAAFVNCRIYAIGGYHFGDHRWLNTMESIRLPELSEVEYQNNYDTLAVYEPPQSNQSDISPRKQWREHEEQMRLGRSHISVVTQMERYIYVFCGKYGEPDAMQPTITNVKSTHVIERYDIVQQVWEDYIIKSCHKINKCYEPGTVCVNSLRRKNPGILFFGGKFDFESKNLTKTHNNAFLMFPQSNKNRQLEAKYYVKGCPFKMKFMCADILQKKKTKDKDKIVEVELFNGDIECVRKLEAYTEDNNYFYFLGCREKCHKLEHEDPRIVENKELLDKFFSKIHETGIHSNINKEVNLKKANDMFFGMENVKSTDFHHPRHAHSVFMLDKSTLKWSSLPIIKYQN